MDKQQEQQRFLELSALFNKNNAIKHIILLEQKIADYESSRVELPVKPEIANDWISVKDRLPDNEETIIVYIPEMDRPEHRPIQFARYVKSIDRFFIDGTPTEWFVNYWQPLMNKPQ